MITKYDLINLKLKSIMTNDKPRIGKDADFNIVRKKKCAKCGRGKRYDFVDDGRSYRGFAVCDKCGTAEELSY